MLFLFNQPQCRQESLLCRVTNQAYGDRVINQFNPTMKHPMFLNSLAPTSKMLVICKSNFSTSLTSFAKGVDFNPRTMEDLIEGLRDKIQSNSTRVKPYLANEAEPVPKGTIRNFELYETALPPTGKEFVFLKGSKSFHISNPLNLTELELLNEIKTFLSFLDEDKNYSIHVIANYPEERLGYRSISKSFLISSKVPAVKLRDYLLSALKSQLDRYKVEDVLYLVLQYKECSLVKERGPLKDILNLSSEVLREYGYDWAERLKDKSLYPLTTMYHIELLLRDAQTTRSQSKLFEIKESLEKYATDLNETFLGKPRAYDISLERVRSQSNIPEIVDELKKLFIEKDQERQLSTQKFVTSIKSQMEKLISKLDSRESELRRRDEEIKLELRRRDEELRRRDEETKLEFQRIRRNHGEEIKLLMAPRRPVQPLKPVKETSDLTIQTMPERNIGKIFYDMEMQIWNDNSNAVKMYDVYVLRSVLYNDRMSLTHLHFIELNLRNINEEIDKIEDDVKRNELKTTAYNTIDRHCALLVQRDAFISVVRRARNLGRLPPKPGLGGKGGARRGYASQVRVFNWKYNEETNRWRMKWYNNFLEFIPEHGIWLVLDSEGKIVLFFREYNDRRVIMGKYTLYFDSLKLLKTFKALPTFKPRKPQCAPTIGEFGVWDTESFHNWKDGVDHLGLLSASYKLPGSSPRSFYLADYASSQELARAFWTDLAVNAKGKVMYAHNAAFDYAFTLDALQDVFGGDALNIVRLKSKIKSITVLAPKVEGQKREVLFKLHCSLAKTDASLRSLCATYQVEDPKGFFPYSFPTPDNIGYVGEVPEFEEFWNNNLNPENNAPRDYYNAVVARCGSQWSLRTEIVRHMELDLISLEQVLIKHAELLWERIGVNIHCSLTLPGIAKQLQLSPELYFDTNSEKLPDGTYKVKRDVSKVVKLPGNHEVESFVRDSYRGGINEVFETSLENGCSHDANSMYSAGMLGPLPVGQPLMTKDVSIADLRSSKYVYFVHCEVDVPPQMFPPLYKLINGVNTGAIGRFEGKWYSPELINAIDNFNVRIISIKMAVRFENSKELFKQYISPLYEIKKEQDELKKSRSPLYSAATRNASKLMQNSGYGQYGMKDNVQSTAIVSQDEAARLSELFPIEMAKPFANGKVLIGYAQVPNPQLLAHIDKSSLSKFERHVLSEGIFGRSSVNVAVAAAVTANARIKLVNTGLAIRQAGGHTMKCATDSWYHTGEMPAQLVSSTALGLWKRELTIDKGIFAGANIYYINPGSDDPVFKCGGLKKAYKGLVQYSEVEDMLYGQPLCKPMNNWTRGLFGPADGAVRITLGSIRLLPDVKKRVPIRDEFGRWLGGVPIMLRNGKEVPYNYSAIWNNRYAPKVAYERYDSLITKKLYNKNFQPYVIPQIPRLNKNDRGNLEYNIIG